ncbi:hypothetical protein LOD99_702 [Oopsacas minuta]|uniref:Uncharacterized protein n=1 Tax=Oopsacas minuta TaxID=111878 RepID=A0AAV7K139_9METZ|nr:hypothetical protein LOD99_702 [Oopsacas minuta]
MDTFQWELNSITELASPNSLKHEKSGQHDSLGLTALAWAILYQRWDLAQKLLDNGIDPNVCCADGISALHMVFVTFSPNMYALPSFRPSYYYIYTEGVSPQCTSIQELEDIPPKFLTSLIEYGARLIPDKWMVTPLTFARMACLKAEAKSMEHHLDLRVHDVLESSILQAVSPSLEMSHENLSASVKHGVTLPESSLIYLWDKTTSPLERLLLLCDKLKLIYPFPSLPIKFYLNIAFTAFILKYDSKDAPPTDQLYLFKLFIFYLEMIGTGYPAHFLQFFRDDALKIANKELRIITHFLKHLEGSLETQYMTDGTIEWFQPIDHIFKTNYSQLLKLDLPPTQSDLAKGEGLVYRLMFALTRINSCLHNDSRLNESYAQWVDELNSSLCRMDPLMSILIQYSNSIHTFQETTSMIEFLLRYGVDINERSRDSLTSTLHKTVQINDPEMFIYLLDKNAYLFIVNRAGLTPLDLIDMKYPGHEKDPFSQTQKVHPPFPLKSLAARVISRHAKLNELFVGHHHSHLFKYLGLHYSS